MKTQKFNNRQLTRYLQEIMLEIHDTRLDAKGEVDFVTKGRALAELLVRKALGGEEIVVEEGDDGKPVTTKVFRKPEAWAIQCIYERLEGRVPQALPDDKSGITAADKVDQLIKDRLNKMTAAAVAETPAPPKHRPKNKRDVDDGIRPG